jgi:CelD/BcsL family acetyltransferase involved in cellulose biosynthesis
MEIFNSLDGLDYIFNNDRALNWPFVFSLPGWMKAWWSHFGAGFETLIFTVRKEGRIIGLAPFKRSGQAISFIGDESVCDYLDFVVATGSENEFFLELLDYILSLDDISIDLGTLRPDSLAATRLLPMVKHRNLEIACRQAGVSYEVVLEDSYQGYLSILDSKQRREITRKLRRLEKLGGVTFRILNDDQVRERETAVFLELMARSRPEKAVFLNDNMRGFFEDIFKEMSRYGALRLGLLNLGAKPIAAVLCFDYNNSMYMYNSGYDPDYSELSAGLLSKMYCIKWAIAHKKKIFDFLKGEEVYKQRLGGQMVNLSACRIGRTP